MARKVGVLSGLIVGRATKPGMYSDGGGLYLRVGPTGAKSWVFRFRVGGKLRDMGLGPLHTFSLAEARAKALECRKLRYDGADPLHARQAARQVAKLEAAKAMTFQQCADAYIEAHRAGWENEKHGAQWAATLAAHVYPVFGELPVAAIDTGLVMKALEPLWTTTTETASRVRGRIESVLDWAATREYRAGENPARWRGHLDNLLPARSKVQKVEHHAAMPYTDVGAFMARLRQQAGAGARALELAILTAGRSGEVLGARCDEFDMGAAVWTVPAGRMKAGREHRVPLSGAALDVLVTMLAVREDAFVFAGSRAGMPLSNMAMAMVLRRMELPELTVHGFRSTFRDWAAERTAYPSEVVEMALAHTVGNKVEAAYRRGDLFDKRRKLMAEWAKYCGTVADDSSSSVVPLRRA
jgi:integrase